jgi:hypothetical protein
MDICTFVFITTVPAIGCVQAMPDNCTYDVKQDKAFCMPSPCPAPPAQYVCKRPDGTTYNYTDTKK